MGTALVVDGTGAVEGPLRERLTELPIRFTADAAEACELLNEDVSQFDVVVASLPEGHRVAQQARSRDANLGVLFLSPQLDLYASRRELMFLAGIPPHAVSLPRNRLDLLIHEVVQVANATRQRRRHRGLLNRTLARLPATSPDVNSREALKEALKESQSRQRALIRELEGAVKLREQFLTIAAHELRTPITALRLSIEAMRRHVEGLALGKLEKMARQERRLTALVEVLLDVSRLQMGRRQLSLEPMDLRETVLELLERFEPERERSGSTFSLEAPTPVPGVWDRLGVEAILSNLIANALKYGRGAAIRVQVLTAGPNAEVRVKDLGIGIAAEDLPKLFAPFVRAVAEKHYGGFGVGLWIARSMAELHGGKVTAKSTLSEGTEFVLELPYAGELPGEVPASSSAR